jgi:CheY-like chemotaxis protein
LGIKAGRHIALTVKDSGHGMEPQVMERIFEPYYTTKEQGKGAGLGLSVIHGIVKNYGGDITVSSRPGKGAIFEVILPTIDEIQTEFEADEHSIPIKGKERILLIDDEDQIINIEQQILERLGYQVTPKTDSQEALEEFAAQPDRFDLVITDMTMPKMTGDQLARRMMEIKPRIPVILCTGYSETISEEKALAMGIDKFVMKPIVKDVLASTIRSVLDNRPTLPN